MSGLNHLLAAALEELSLAGIRNAEWKITGKHLLVKWKMNGKECLYCARLKPNNDWRSDAADTRARIRNFISLKKPPTPRKRGGRR